MRSVTTTILAVRFAGRKRTHKQAGAETIRRKEVIYHYGLTTCVII